MAESRVIGGIIAGLFAAPFIAVALRLGLSKAAPRAATAVALGSALLLLATAVLIRARVSFVERTLNPAWFALCYGAYCYLAATCWSIRSRLVRWPLVAVLGLPIAAFTALNTLGVLGLMFILGDDVRAPASVMVEGPFVCEIDWWGAAMTDGGYAVHLYRRPAWLPFLQHEAARISVNQNAHDDDVTCPQALAAYGKR